MKTVSNFATARTVLAAAVLDDGTFTIPYPSGFSQTSFNAGLAASGGKVIVNDNDTWDQADPGFSFAFGESVITVTNLTGATLAAGSEILLQLEAVDGNDVLLLPIHVTLAAITGNGDVVTSIRPGVDGYVESVDWIQEAPVTTSGDAADLNLEINSTNVTGGVVALTSAAATPLGKVITGSAITANNRITRNDTLSVEAANVTAFAEGSGTLLVRIRKDPTNAY